MNLYHPPYPSYIITPRVRYTTTTLPTMHHSFTLPDPI